MAYLAIKLRQQRDFALACKVVLLPEKRYYAPGDLLEGKIIISHGKTAMQLRGIRVALQGSSLAKFREREQIQHKNEIFLDEGVYVFGGGSVRTKTQLPPGTTSLPFQIQIPNTTPLPSSFKSSLGVIIYQVLGIIDIGTQMLKKGEKTINFVGALEIGRNEPGIEVEKFEKKFLSGADVENSARFIFKTFTSGFVIGRECYFEMKIEKNGHEIKEGVVSLIQKVTYYGGTVSRAWKDTYTVVGEVVSTNPSATSMMDEEDSTWRGVLTIGKNLVPSFTGGVIEFRYLLRVSLETVDGILLRSEHPVKIGTSHVDDVNQATEEQMKALTLSDCPGPSNFDTESMADSTRPGSPSSLPRYSILSMRTGSFETLPPDYEDALVEEEVG